jgi:hypothetical protein
VEDPTSGGTTHDLLLALAGRVDDDLLRWARELVALGEDARAVEMLTASLVAARAVLPPPVRSALVAAAHTARTDLGPAAALPPPRPETGTEHRFSTPRGDDPVAGAVLEFPARPLTGCSVLLTRRLTPAGSAPGPLPHPVVLVRVHDHTRRSDVLAYQLGAALERAGAPASVEVLPADGPVPGYHAAALDAAVELREDVADERPWRPAPQAAEVRTVSASQPQPIAPEPAAPPTPGQRYPGEAAAQEDDHATAEDSAATAQLQPAGGRDLVEGGESATARLAPDPGHRRLDDRADEDEDDRQADDDDLEDSDEDEDDYEEHDDQGDREDEEEDEDPAAHAEQEFPEPPSPHPLAAPRRLQPRDESRPARPTPLPSPPPPPPPTPLPSRGDRGRPTVTPISRARPNPIPLVRRNGPNPIPRSLPATDSRPALRRVDDVRDGPEPSVDERSEGPQEAQPPRRETPAFESLSDPLNGPLHQPLLAPLLDPTRPEDDPLGAADRRPIDRRPDDRRPEPAAPQDDEWSEEWLSGTWAMAPSVLDDGADIRPEPEPEPVEDVDPGRPAPRPVPRSPAARHRFPDVPPPNGSPTHEQSEEADEPDEPDGELGLRPESVARLSDADRQLLARLQAELLEGRRQRIGRSITNGSHRGSPPDFAG